MYVKLLKHNLFCFSSIFYFCFTCADDPTNSAGSFEMVENFDEGILKKDIYEQENGLDIKKEPYNGK